MAPTRERLENGLTLLVQALPGLASASIGLVVKTGSRDETQEEVGLSHLAEHMLFQGTARRDTLELSRLINAVGGSLDAYTSRESTAYYAKVPAVHLPLAMDVLADMFRHSRFSLPLLEKEKKIILEEIHMYDDEPEELVHDLFAQALWPRHPLGRSITGTRSQLRQFTRRHLLSFVRRHYQPGRLLLSVAGKVTAAQVRKLAEQHFGNWSGQGVLGTDGATVPRPASAQIIKHREQEQVHVCVGVPSVCYTDSRRMAALALSNVLGGGTNSRLFYEVRERRALVYSIYSFLDFYRDTGVMGIYFACHPRKVRTTLEVITEQIQRLTAEPVSDQEIHDLREQMRGNLLLSLENSSTHMWRMIQHEVYLQYHPTLAATLDSIQQLAEQDIQGLAKDLFLKTPLSLAAVGPITERQIPSLKID